MPLNPFIGQIMPAAFGVIPRGWHLCDGSLLPINQFQAMFSLLGTTYGGNGTTNFALPDLRGRAILGTSGTTSGLFPPGLQSGTSTVPLTPSQIPQHTHILQASTTAGSGTFPVSPSGKIFGTNTSAGGAEKIFATTGSAEVALAVGTNVMIDGGGQPHNNMQPYLAINYMIATAGIFPSRS
jgi:microcystin-dependent protein